MRVLAPIALTCLVASLAPAATIQWQDDLRAAHTLAQKANKPLLLHFTTDNCGWCDRLEAGAFKSAEVQSAVENGYIPVKIHAGKQPQLAEMFKVTKFPTDVIVTTGGEALVHQVSPQKPADYTAMLDTTASKYHKTAGLAKTETPAAAAAAAKVAQTSATGGASGFELPVTPAGMMPPAAAMTPATKTPATKTPAKTTPAKTTSAKTGGMQLPPMGAMMPPAAASTPTRKTVDAATDPTLAVEGYCSVSVVEDEVWVQGNPEFGVVHLGQLYLFTDEAKMKKFLANPVPYTPMLNGIDVVRFFEERKIVPGKREFCAVDPDHGRMFMFADLAALEHFENTFERYVESSIAVMDKAVTASNP